MTTEETTYSQTSDEKRLATIGRLLAQAENTTHPEEAATYMAAAQNMATRHGIDLAVARASDQKQQKAKQNEVQVVRIDIGKPRNRASRGEGTYADLLIAIAEAQEILWLRRSDGSWVELYGMKFDIEYTQNIYAVLLVQMVAEVQAFIDEGTWRDHGDDEKDARISFCYSFTQIIKQRLIEARREAERDAQEQHKSDGVNVALVLADQRREIRSTYGAARRKVTTYNRASGQNRAGHNKGRTAGRNANLHDHGEIGATKGISK